MRNTNSHSLKVSFGKKDTGKYKTILIDFIVRTIEKKTGSTLAELKARHTQKELYRIGLKYFTTTNKTICTALQIPVEAGTRRKRDLEKEGRLKASLKIKICPFTKHRAKFLSTNLDNYNDLKPANNES